MGDRIGRNGDDLVVESLITLAIGIIVDAVEQKIIKHAPLAIDVIGTGPHQAVDRTGRRGRRRLARTRYKAEKVRVVTSDERESSTLILSDDLASLARFGLNLQSHIADLDGCLSCAHRQR